jgi:hypothetical protein
MEAYSLHDNGEDLQFCVFVYNIQKGVDLDYRTGKNRVATENDTPYYGFNSGFKGTAGTAYCPDESEGPLTLEKYGTYTVKAKNGNGTLYLKGTVSGGRFDCTFSESEAAHVTVYKANSGFVLAFGSKYIVISDSSSGASLIDDPNAASIFEWNTSLNTFVVAEDGNNRGFGADETYTKYDNISPYDSGESKYNWGVFTPVDASSPSTPENGGTTGGEQGGTTGGNQGNTGDQGGTGSGGDDIQVSGTYSYVMKDVFGSETLYDGDYTTADGLVTYHLVKDNVAYNKDGTFRVYANKSATINTTDAVSSIKFNGKGKDSGATTVTVKVSNDGSSWVTVATISVSSLAEYTADLGGAYTYIQIASTGKQLQIKSMTFTFGK